MYKSVLLWVNVRFDNRVDPNHSRSGDDGNEVAVHGRRELRKTGEMS